MKMTEIPYFILKQFMLYGTGVPIITYDELQNVETEEELNFLINSKKVKYNE